MKWNDSTKRGYNLTLSPNNPHLRLATMIIELLERLKLALLEVVKHVILELILRHPQNNKIVVRILGCVAKKAY
ncbi:hypothetical protein PsorP6_002649 [Peronosclerospora sorghi]|uniref:Uncharacterized protein n=1 Tax=Peronosclerospora sorghi TaxID=230839 RepID=A0ACC0WWW0_9STRA|nr:hypothetical protein PsorP6_002649 [Peronosclerospora sorghi]